MYQSSFMLNFDKAKSLKEFIERYIQLIKLYS